MGSIISGLLLGSIILVGINIIILCAFALYIAVHKYRKSKQRTPQIQKERINYDDKINFKTRLIPLEFGDHFFMNKERSKLTNAPPSSSSNTPINVDDLDVSTYFSEVFADSQIDIQEREKDEKQPSLLVSFSYNVSLLELNVAVIRGKDFAEDDDLNYHIIVSVVLLPEGSINHSSRGVPPNPIFKDNFLFSITSDEIKASQVKFNVWKIDKYSQKCPIGEIIMNMKYVFEENDKLYSSGFELWKTLEIKDKLSNETSNGEILTSLQYLPGAERVNVTVMKGRDLKLQEFDKDIYVKVSAVMNGKVVKNKKTSLMRKTQMPLFNETASLVLKPHSNLTLQNMCIILSVYAYRSRGPHRRLIGRVVLGEGDISNEVGAKHWKNMVEAPHKILAEWQELK